MGAAHGEPRKLADAQTGPNQHARRKRLLRPLADRQDGGSWVTWKTVASLCGRRGGGSRNIRPSTPYPSSSAQARNV